MNSTKLLILLCVLMPALLKIAYGMPSCLMSAEEQAKKDAKVYLTQYGYLPLPLYRPGEPDTRAFDSGLIKFQQFFGLPQTGVLDEATIEHMNIPRCGLPDVGHFVVSGNKWTSNNLKYRIDTYTNDLADGTIREDIRNAWQIWADVTPLTFTEVSAGQQADFVIEFRRRSHGDGYSFDGSGGVLAHAFFPRNGRCHFDDDETWTHGSYSGINLFIVAVHEFGHALGLGHSDVPGAVMLPYYEGYKGNSFRLGSDDIRGIQSLYGSRPTTGGSGSGSSGSGSGGSGTGSGSGDSGSGSGGSGSGSGGSGGGDPTSPPSRACSGEFETVVKATDGTIYGFTGGYVWDLTRRLSNGPSRVVGTTSIFSSGLDNRSGPQAAVTVAGKTYVFSGCSVWRFDNTRFEIVQPIRDVFQGLPCNIDAAFNADDGYTYFFLGRYVYRYQGFSGQYFGPFSSLGWNNFPTSLTSFDAITPSGNTNNDVYIFSGKQYWKLNQSTKRFYSGYPRNTVSIWLSNCSP